MKIVFNGTGMKPNYNILLEQLVGLQLMHHSITINLTDFTTLLQALAYHKCGGDYSLLYDFGSLNEFRNPSTYKPLYDIKFEYIVKRDLLVSGHYGTFNNMKIMVRKTVEPGHIEIEAE